MKLTTMIIRTKQDYSLERLNSVVPKPDRSLKSPRQNFKNSFLKNKVLMNQNLWNVGLKNFVFF